MDGSLTRSQDRESDWQTVAGASPGRLVAVSNRILLPGRSHAGGLAHALRSVFANSPGVWLGWSGTTSDSEAVQVHRQAGSTYLTIDLSDALYERFYLQYANRVLWPMLHRRMDLIDYRAEDEAGYYAANVRFAEALAAEIRCDDRVWVHDYHLLPLGRMVRERGFQGPVGLFLHTPVPPAQILASLPRHRRLLGSLLAYDLIGLQTQNDCDNLRHYLRTEHSATLLEDGRLQLPGGHRLRLAAFPIGLDHQGLRRVAETVAGKTPSDGISRLVSVDRMDYTKGLPQRIRAYQHLLDGDARWRGRLQLVQVAAPSRSELPEYQQIERATRHLVRRVNTRHGQAGWQPIRYIGKTLPVTTLVGMYRSARVGVVTPLCDGMNLVAKEYVAAQDADDPGVLVLSSLAGAAYELDGALVVNPYDIEDCADAMARALRMSILERRQRWNAMMAALRSNPIDTWVARFDAAMVSSRTPAPSGLAGVARTMGLRTVPTMASGGLRIADSLQ